MGVIFFKGGEAALGLRRSGMEDASYVVIFFKDSEFMLHTAQKVYCYTNK